MKKCSPFLCWRRFTHVNISKCENKPGVYGFWYKRNCIYIGKTEKQGLRDRLLQHWNGSHNNRLRDWIKSKKSNLMFCFKPIDVAQVDIAERYYIYKYQPLTNIQLSKSEYLEIKKLQGGDDGNCDFSKKG